MATPFDLYRVTGTAGYIGTPGAPILHFDLLVHSNTGSVSGLAQITQAVAPPNNLIEINNVTGTVRELVFGGTVTLVVALQGTYFKPGPPGTNFIILENFAAHFSVDPQWDGAGSFDYSNGSQVVNNVPVDSSKTTGPPIHTLYGVVIHGAIATGDLVRMKEIAAKAEQFVAQAPDVQEALDAIKAEIAKAGA
jgi:Domain of unknown function (DUF1842)/Domain of unknown function (DUF1843)